MDVLPVSWFPGLNANSKIRWPGFQRKGKEVHYSSDKEEDRESHPLNVLSQSSDFPLNWATVAHVLILGTQEAEIRGPGLKASQVNSSQRNST
jgi:hypothetical protein